MEAQTKMFRIPEENLGALQVAFAKLSKKAAKLGMAAITFTVVREEVVEHVTYAKDALGFETTKVKSREYRRFAHVEVHGDQPKIAGWTFAAALDHLEDGNLIRLTPGTEGVPAEFRTSKPHCEHCQVQRRRLSTFVLVDEAGVYKQVGRQCLRDFLGHGNPEDVAKYAELLFNARDLADAAGGDGFGGGGVKTLLGTLEFLAAVAFCIRIDGWTSRSQARESFIPKLATADIAAAALRPAGSAAVYLTAEALAFREQAQNPDDEAIDVATRALDWARGLDAAVDNDYLWNCRLAAQGEYLVDRQLGIAASIIPAYLREQGKAVERRVQAEARAASQHFGTVGKREIFKLTCTKKISVDGNYGLTTICKFVQDGTANIATWFASGLAPAIEEGQTYTIKGTVKEHKDYQGGAETVLTRCAVQV